MADSGSKPSSTQPSKPEPSLKEVADAFEASEFGQRMRKLVEEGLKETKPVDRVRFPDTPKPE